MIYPFSVRGKLDFHFDDLTQVVRIGTSKGRTFLVKINAPMTAGEAIAFALRYTATEIGDLAVKDEL